MSGQTTAKPLDGILVVALEQAVARRLSAELVELIRLLRAG